MHVNKLPVTACQKEIAISVLQCELCKQYGGALRMAHAHGKRSPDKQAAAAPPSTGSGVDCNQGGVTAAIQMKATC